MSCKTIWFPFYGQQSANGGDLCYFLCTNTEQTSFVTFYCSRSIIIFIVIWYQCCVCSQAGMLRTEQGEYWIEPSDQEPQNRSEGRPHVIFKRSAVDKVEAWHRSKRSVESKYRDNNNNSERKRLQKHTRSSNRRYDSKEMRDRRRREHIEARRRRLEELKRNPAEYKKYLLKQRNEQRAILANRTNTQLRSNSASHSNSLELSRSLEVHNRNKSRSNLNRNPKIQPSKGKRRRRRKTKNCATKQPAYLWEKNNFDREMAAQRYRNKVIYYCCPKI